MKLEFCEISKSYGKNMALQGFSAVLSPGIYALLGPNGSGKTTLMNILTDSIKANTGRILYHGDDGTPPESTHAMGVRFREKLGFMPQYPGMYPDFTVADFLNYITVLKDMGNSLRGKEKQAYLTEQIETVLREVELTEFAHRRIRTLSGGMKQRLALAQAVLGEPEILILDEPTAGLDPKQRITVRNFISRISAGRIILIATHIVSDIEYIADGVIMLKKGKIVDMAPPRELAQKMRGNVWLAECEPEEAEALQQQFPVVNLSRGDGDSGRIVLRLLADRAPTDTATPAEPTLEDYYLNLFGQT